MKIRARRGVCIGVDRHLQAGDLADLDAAQVTFLVGIGAVELVTDVPASVTVESERKPADDPKAKTIEPDQKASGKSGKKEI